MAGPYGLSTLWTESVSAVTATNTVELGTVRVLDHDEYVYCYNAGGADIAPKRVVTVSGGTGYSVTVSTVTDPYSRVVGAVVHATLTTATYGWICRHGAVILASTGVAAIQAGRQLTCANNGTSTPCSGATGLYATFGKALTATTTAGTFLAFITC